jgi:hypothetical protein
MVPPEVSSIQVANAEKILSRMRANPRDWRIEDLKVLAAHYSIEYRQPGSSHVYSSIGGLGC